jgi:SAM-dependent methyltransferase
MQKEAIKLVTHLHQNLVFDRRTNKLADALKSLIGSAGSESLKGLDVGAGSGVLASLLSSDNSKLKLTGIDLIVRPETKIPVTKFDGLNIPFENKSFDFSMIVDVLHHADDPEKLLSECARVAKKYVFIKDHYCENFYDDKVLRLMDWVGNRGFDIPLPYGYFSREKWNGLFRKYNLTPEETITEIGLYPMPLNFVFEKRLHFVTRLKVN